MGRRRRSILVGLTLAVAGAVTTVMIATGQGRETDRDGIESAVHGMQLGYQHNSLAIRSDAVIVGVAGAAKTEPFAGNDAIPELARSEPAYANSEYVSAPVTVETVLAGQAPAEIDVAIDVDIAYGDRQTAIAGASSGYELEPGERYVLFVDQGRGLWAGNWLPLGPQAVGIVTSGTVTFGDGRTLTLDELTSAIDLPVDSRDERYLPTP